MFPIHPLLILADQNNKKGYDPPNEVAVHFIITERKQLPYFILKFRVFFSTPEVENGEVRSNQIGKGLAKTLHVQSFSGTAQSYRATHQKLRNSTEDNSRTYVERIRTTVSEDLQMRRLQRDHDKMR